MQVGFSNYHSKCYIMQKIEKILLVITTNSMATTTAQRYWSKIHMDRQSNHNVELYGLKEKKIILVDESV